MNELHSTDWWRAVNAEFIYEQELANRSGYNFAYPNYQHIDPLTSCDQQTYCSPTESVDMGYIDANYRYPEMQTYAPCAGPKPWNFAYCYGFYGEPACQFTNIVDMEDFMYE